MRVFHSDIEQDYHPGSSFFCGRFTSYPDVPGRTRSILSALEGREGLRFHKPPPLEPHLLESVHDPGYVAMLAEVCGSLKPGEECFPFHARPLPLLLRSPYPRVRMGYYALDGSTPLMRESYPAGISSAASALAGADALLEGEPWAYALARPPGHHAGAAGFAGYCLFNNAALAAQALLPRGKVAIVDVDYHHGNGSQEIFWERDDVFYASLHCRPEEAYPYVTGEAEERGAGVGRGHTLNLPLPGGTDWAAYRPQLEKALDAVQAFDPASIVLSLGFDTLASDPIGSFALRVEDYSAMAGLIAQLDRPTLLLQEGGYDVESLGDCIAAFLAGLPQPHPAGERAAHGSGASGNGASGNGASGNGASGNSCHRAPQNEGGRGEPVS